MNKQPQIERRVINRAAKPAFGRRGPGTFSGKYVEEVKWFVEGREFDTRKAAQAYIDAR